MIKVECIKEGPEKVIVKIECGGYLMDMSIEAITALRAVLDATQERARPFFINLILDTVKEYIFNDTGKTTTRVDPALITEIKKMLGG